MLPTIRQQSSWPSTRIYHSTQSTVYLATLNQATSSHRMQDATTRALVSLSCEFILLLRSRTCWANLIVRITVVSFSENDMVVQLEVKEEPWNQQPGEITVEYGYTAEQHELRRYAVLGKRQQASSTSSVIFNATSVISSPQEPQQSHVLQRCWIWPTIQSPNSSLLSRLELVPRLLSRLDTSCAQRPEVWRWYAASLHSKAWATSTSLAVILLHRLTMLRVDHWILKWTISQHMSNAGHAISVG